MNASSKIPILGITEINVPIEEIQPDTIPRNMIHPI